MKYYYNFSLPFSCLPSSFVTYLFQYAMMSVVRGRAMISPMKPSSAPHTDSDSSSIAGFSPMAFPITFGVTMVSVIICTMMNTSTAEPKTIQKFSPVSAAFSPRGMPSG